MCRHMYIYMYTQYIQNTYGYYLTAARESLSSHTYSITF